MITFEQFARLFGFGQNDANRHKIYYTLHFDASKIRFMFPKKKRECGNDCGSTSLLCIFDFIWEEFKEILKSPLKSYGYVPYTLHMIERVLESYFWVWQGTPSLENLEWLTGSVEERRATAPQVSPPRAASGRGKQGDKPHLLFRRFLVCCLGMCKSQHAANVRFQHERCERKKITKSMKEIRAHLNLWPPSSPIASESEENPEIESFDEMIACFDNKTLVQQWYGDTSFSDFSFDYGGMGGASSSHPPPFESPPLVLSHDDEEEEEGREDDNDE
jgi:hypothetical protein